MLQVHSGREDWKETTEELKSTESMTEAQDAAGKSQAIHDSRLVSQN